MFARPRRGDQHPPQGQLRLVPVRKPEARSVPAGLPERRIPYDQPRRRRLLDDDPKSDQRQRPAAHGRLEQQSGQFQSASVIKKSKKARDSKNCGFILDFLLTTTTTTTTLFI